MYRMNQNHQSEIVMIGDRLYTDIAMGKKSGITTILVLISETKGNVKKNLRGNRIMSFLLLVILILTDILIVLTVV